MTTTAAAGTAERTGRLVPYVTAHEGEQIPYDLTFACYAAATDGIRLSFHDPVEQDWMFGVLWHRQGLHRRGRPLWRLVNTPRQRRCMVRHLCQVCGSPAVDEAGRVWWVLPEPPARAGAVQFTHAPPTCRLHIPVAVEQCPRLRRGGHVYTAAGSTPYGVMGMVYKLRHGRLVQVEEATELPLEAFHRLEYALATQLVVALDDLRPEPFPLS
ncbi:hypothetical protein ACWDA3_26170 [Nonomuraea rubra]